MKIKNICVSDFWKNTWSSTIGTIIGIVLTFGTTYLLQRCEREETERIVALMVIGNIDNYCNLMQESIDEISEQDSVCGIVLAAEEFGYKNLPDSVLQKALVAILNKQITIMDNTADKIFASGLDIWKNIEDSRFIENAGKCFSGKAAIDNMITESNDYQNRLYDYYYEELLFGSPHFENESLREHCIRVLSDSKVKSYIIKKHQLYVPALKSTIMMLKEHNEINKQLMKITDEELRNLSGD